MKEYFVVKDTQKKDEIPFLLQFDGLAAPNPGEITGGSILFSPKGEVFFERGDYLGYGTNNQAEYYGLLYGLKTANKIGVRSLLIEGDSNLIVNQIQGTWKSKDETLVALRNKCLAEIRKFDFVAIRHVYRTENKKADFLTNEALRRKESFLWMD